MTARCPPFAFVELVSPYNKKNITRWLEDTNFMFSWQEHYLTRSLRSLVRYCSCHSNIKFISSRHRVISSIYVAPCILNPCRLNMSAFIMKRTSNCSLTLMQCIHYCISRLTFSLFFCSLKARKVNSSNIYISGSG